MDKTKRSLRRHHYARLKNNRKHNYLKQDNNMHVNTPALCSCPYCANPRKLGELTVQEHRSIDKLNESRFQNFTAIHILDENS